MLLTVRFGAKFGATAFLLSTGGNLTQRGEVLRLRNGHAPISAAGLRINCFQEISKRPAHHKESRPTASCPTPRSQIDNYGPRRISRGPSKARMRRGTSRAPILGSFTGAGARGGEHGW
jgi:hypothetical protein